MTLGQLIFFGGIALIAFGGIMLVLCIPIFRKQRKNLEKRIQEEYR